MSEIYEISCGKCGYYMTATFDQMLSKETECNNCKRKIVKHRKKEQYNEIISILVSKVTRNERNIERLFKSINN